ncbi:P-loop containing nucleoside triphosphate hydrolase protein [Xylaria sp. FL1042]|nr:P-loop containing nucleoside triphosphate hydrolase protein [Xylaria sp. FL1042]
MTVLYKMASMESLESKHELNHAQKRPLHDLATDDAPLSDAEEGPFRKRAYANAAAIGSSQKLSRLMVHRVECTRQTLGHQLHAQIALYLDQPRLFKGDSGASPLRGRNAISSVEEYVGAHEDISLVILKMYDCAGYHDHIQDAFVRLPRPNHPPIPDYVRPYFSVLRDTSILAVAHHEAVAPSESLERVLGRLAKLDSTLADCYPNLKPPYLQVYHTQARMKTLARETLDESTAALVFLLVDYVVESFGPEYQEAEALFSQGLVTKKHLAKLYRPNEVLVKVEEDQPVGYVSKNCPVHLDGPLNLNCYKWTFDGQFQREEKVLTVAWPSDGPGPIPIASLSAYPLRYDPTRQLETTLRGRGTMFWACHKRCLVGYDAPIVSFEIQVSNPRYMIDMSTYKELHLKDKNQTIDTYDDLGEETMNLQEPLEDPFLLLLPPKILGFGLHDKKWKSLFVKHLKPVHWNKRAFEPLVLDPQKKELIEAMVRTHINSNMTTDVIEGKGNGLIILLHGGPGTGKTLTAESVAELAEKPLYRVTCGDIGTDPESVERYLESVLYIGTIWKAVVLLDESDVFLEEREKTDLQRNALVSVFLRVLEYYEGILILTSNRVGIFDEAFKSRVQLALHYPPLDAKGRWQIWNNFIKLLQKQQEEATAQASDRRTGLADGERVNTEELQDKIDVLARENLNGRQIRNAITSARQLARFRDKPLSYTHLDQTIRVVDEFEKYVEKTHGHNARDYAQAAGLRLE